MLKKTNIIPYLKDKAKDLFHSTSFIPYRKPSKRYKVWNHKKEKRFVRKIADEYIKNAEFFNAINASIVMPVHNRAYCIKDAIESVISQSHANWNLIIIDDGSTDNLNSAIEKFLKDIRIKIIRTRQGGVAKARNTGLKMANGKYVFYLDSDNKWFSDYIRNMLVFMETHKLFATYCGARIVDEEKTIGFYGESFNWTDCVELNHIDINAFAHRNDDFVKQIMFDESLKRLVDWDFILAITKNKPTAYAPFIGVEYYDGQKGNRITFTEHPGNEINSVIKKIQQKHLAANS